MTQHLITHALFIFFLFTSFAGVAKAEIARCIGTAGSTTFSDVPCAAGTDAILAPAIKKAVLDITRTPARTDRFFAAENARSVASGNRTASVRRFPRDDITLQSARLLTSAMDSTPVHERRRKLATLAVYP